MASWCWSSSGGLRAVQGHCEEVGEGWIWVGGWDGDQVPGSVQALLKQGAVVSLGEDPVIHSYLFTYSTSMY